MLVHSSVTYLNLIKCCGPCMMYALRCYSNDEDDNADDDVLCIGNLTCSAYFVEA